MISFLTIAATTATATASSYPANVSTDWTRALLQLIAIIFIFYLFFIRPQQKRAKEQIQMLASLKKGDRVMVGGLFGTIQDIISDTEILLEIADGVQIKVLRSFISQVVIEETKKQKKKK